MDRGCDKYLSMLSPYLDGELSAAHKAELELHLQSCPDCRSILDSYKAVTSDMYVVQPPEGFHQRVMNKVRKRSKKKKIVFPFRYGTLAAAMVALVILGASGTFDGLFRWAGIADSASTTTEGSVEEAAAAISADLTDSAAQTRVVSSALEAYDSEEAGATAEAASEEAAPAEVAAPEPAEPGAVMMLAPGGGTAEADLTGKTDDNGVIVSGVDLPESSSLTFTAVVTGVSDTVDGCVINLQPSDEVGIDSTDDVVVSNELADSAELEVGSEITITVSVSVDGDEITIEATSIK